MVVKIFILQALKHLMYDIYWLHDNNFVIIIVIRRVKRHSIELCLFFLLLQNPLPQLPVPPLHESLEKYLRSLIPIVSHEQFQRTKKLLEEFGKPGGRGEYLQNKLLAYAATESNWVSCAARMDLYQHKFIIKLLSSLWIVNNL